MAIKLIIEGNAVYEIDEECLECQRKGRTFGRKESDVRERSDRKGTAYGKSR